MTSSTLELPALPAEITPEWLSSKLRHKVRSAVNTRNIWGTASKLFYTLTYEEDQDAQTTTSSATRPKHICIKGVFDPENLAAQPWTLGQALREAEFYEKLAPSIENVVEPMGWWSGMNEKQGIVIMDDLAKEGCIFPPEVEAYSVEDVKKGVEQLAGLHAKYWGQKQEDHPWLINTYDGAIQYLASLWIPIVSAPGRPALPPSLMDGERCAAAVTRYCTDRNPRFRTLLHGDAHIGNIYFTADNRIGFLDWSAIHLGSCFHDVVYHMCSMMSVEDRRKYEWDVLDHYLEALHRLGGPKLDRADEEVLREYKRSFVASMMWLVCPYEVQSKERVDEGIKRAVAACEDHGVLDVVLGTSH